MRERWRRGLRFFLLAGELVMRQRVQEVQCEGEACRTGQKIADRVYSFDAVDAEEARQDKDAGNEVDALSEAG